jgi:transcription antitermination factor NusG
MNASRRKNSSTPQNDYRPERNAELLDLERLYETPSWYAVYTCVNREKLVAAQFVVRGIEHFLPLYESVRDWSDRRVKLQSPLFPGYLFVFTTLRQRLPILMVPGVVNLVSVARQPVPLSAEIIQTLRDGLNRVSTEPCPYLAIGQRVSICGGPLKGLTGILLRKKAAPRVVISIEEIQQSFLADVDENHLIPMEQPVGTAPPAWAAVSLR